MGKRKCSSHFKNIKSKYKALVAKSVDNSNGKISDFRNELLQLPHSGSLPCREDEFTQILDFVQSRILERTGGCMYISGVPGTGKTATLHQVIRQLIEDHDNGDLPFFKYVEINGLKLTEPKQAYVQIYKQLTGEVATADHATALLDYKFSNSSNTDPIVLLVDELDMLWTRKQQIMYNIFDWPTRPGACVTVLAVANTMDLPERVMMNRVASRLGLTRLTFQPYTYSQLDAILRVKLQGLSEFDSDALQLASRKVAALSGDARRALDICRRAAEISATKGSKKQRIVTVPCVQEAINEMFAAPKILAMRSASLQEQFLLKSIIAEFQSCGLEEALYARVYFQHVSLCRFEGITPPTLSEFALICSRMASLRLILVDGAHRDFQQRIRLNVSTDDVMFALTKSEDETTDSNS